MLYPKEPPVQAPDKEAALIRAYGRHSLAFLGLAPENLHFLAPGGTGLVNYRQVSNVAVVLGDPVCPPEACEYVTRSFLDFCARRSWRVAFYQAYPENLALYRGLNLRSFKMGEEAIIHPQTFTLKGSALANVRTSCRRAEREGVYIQWYDGVPPPEVMRQLEHISNAWLEHKGGSQAAETNFSTGRLHALRDNAERAEMIAGISPSSSVFHKITPRFTTAVAMTSAGRACAFVTFIPLYGSPVGEATGAGDQYGRQGWGWTLDLMRREPDAPPGVMELLLVRAIDEFRSCGAEVVNLGMVALADSWQEMTSIERQLAGFVSDRLHLLEGRQTLLNFKQKFDPSWESRYMVVNTMFALPKIALALLRLRNYAGNGLVRLIK